MLPHLLTLLAQLWMPGVSRTGDSLIRANDRFAYVILAETSCMENAQEFEDRARAMLNRYQNKDFVSIEWYSSKLEPAIDESRSDVIGDDTFGRWQNLFRSKSPALWGQVLKIGTFEGLRRRCNSMRTEARVLKGADLFQQVVDGKSVRLLDFRLSIGDDGASSFGHLHLQADHIESTAMASKLCDRYFRAASRYESRVVCVIGEDAIRPFQVYLVSNPFVDFEHTPADVSELKTLYTCDRSRFKKCVAGPI